MSRLTYEIISIFEVCLNSLFAISLLFTCMYFLLKIRILEDKMFLLYKSCLTLTFLGKFAFIMNEKEEPLQESSSFNFSKQDIPRREWWVYKYTFRCKYFSIIWWCSAFTFWYSRSFHYMSLLSRKTIFLQWSAAISLLF
jgi:hypothetical protein